MTDLAIIGGGPAGYVAAEKAAKAGLGVILFEKGTLGGVCLNEGCIPTKTMLYSAKLLDQARHSEKYGINADGVTLDFQTLMKRKTKVIRKLTGGIKVRMRDAGVQVVEEEAFILGKDDAGFNLKAGEELYQAGMLLICTGSETFIPPVSGLDRSQILTNREILELESIPESLTIMGGGVIGMEFASLFNSLGTKVSVIEMLPEILGGLDTEISSMLRGIYAKKGVEFHLGCKVTAIAGNKVIFETPEGTRDCIESEKILVSVGRRARMSGFGLENIGVECGRGIIVDDRMRTNVAKVYAAGDVTGFSMLAHTASREAEVAVANMLGQDERMNYQAIPGVVYTNPEVAGVGLTEAQAAGQGIDFKVTKLPMAFSGRFVAENEGGEGICKIIAENGTGRILGVHMLGNPCSEIIQGACIALEKGLTAPELEKVVFPHPSVSEILKETAGALD